jgi:DNA-binding transcriptional regulator YiaG
MTDMGSLRKRVALMRELPAPASRRALREASGLSLREIAEACDVSAQAVCAWELGQRTPRGDNLELYVRALRVLREADN